MSSSSGKPARQQAPARLYPEEGWPDGLRTAAGSLASQYGLGFVLARDNPDFSDFVRSGKPWTKRGFPPRFAVLWLAERVNPLSVLSWRNGLVEDFKHDLGVDREYLFVPVTADTTEESLKALIGAWTQPLPDREVVGLERGSVVSMPPEVACDSYHPGFLAVSPRGALATVLDRLDDCRRRYAHLIGSKVGESRTAIHRRLDPLLRRASGREGEPASEAADIDALRALVEKSFPVDRARIPRVMLLGPSGSGKSLIARYLAWRISPGREGPLSRPFKRVPIPEYLGREDQLEYDLFGFRGGAYTHAPDTGSRGILLERIGGVIFLDEIGDASPSLQAKLLAYLDDYLVTPRGWVGEPVFCPTLVVAATNRPIERWASEDAAAGSPHALFRNDLLRRFNVILHIPGLNERKDEFPYILDAMLQMPEINPQPGVRELGRQALERLKAIDYSMANFRLLEGLLGRACARARRSGRDYIVAGDIDP